MKGEKNQQPTIERLPANDKSLSSYMLKTRTRRYFFNTHEYTTDQAMTIRESRIRDGQFEINTIYIWKSDLPVFLLALCQCVQDLDLDPAVFRRLTQDNLHPYNELDLEEVLT